MNVSVAAKTRTRANGMAKPAWRNLPNWAKYIMPMPHTTVAALATRAEPVFPTASPAASAGEAPRSSSSL